MDLFPKHVHESHEGPFLDISISPVFRPANYGSMDNTLRGKWATAQNDQGKNDVRAILQMPWSGPFLRQRLMKHAGEVAYDIRYAKEHPDKEMDDRQYQQYINWLEAILSRLRRIVKQIPDGPPDHIFCVGSVSYRDQARHTVVSESEDKYSAGELRPRNILMAMKESGRRGGGILGTTPLSAWKPGPVPSPHFRLVEQIPGRSSATLINNRLRTDID
jgi:hypothetical protein